jgi:hypothetical protein
MPRLQHLQAERTSLQKQYDLMAQNLAGLRDAFAIETDPGIRFKLKHQIGQQESQLAELDTQLEKLERQIQAQSSSETPSKLGIFPHLETSSITEIELRDGLPRQRRLNFQLASSLGALLLGIVGLFVALKILPSPSSTSINAQAGLTEVNANFPASATPQKVPEPQIPEGNSPVPAEKPPSEPDSNPTKPSPLPSSQPIPNPDPPRKPSNQPLPVAPSPSSKLYVSIFYKRTETKSLAYEIFKTLQDKGHITSIGTTDYSRTKIAEKFRIPGNVVMVYTERGKKNSESVEKLLTGILKPPSKLHQDLLKEVDGKDIQICLF